jgi:hypothetical protein
MEAIQNIAQFLATFCCSVFAGAAVYITLVEHPARVECGTEVATTEFAPSYRRAAVLQASLAVLGFLFSAVAWLTGAKVGWLVGGMLLVSVIPFTLTVIMPTNRELLDSSLDKRAERAAQLLSRWGQLHAVRSILSLLALLTFLYMLTVA